MSSDKIWLVRIRNWIGFLGMILPWISLIGAAIYSAAHGVPDAFWSDLSISATYYICPALTGILTAASIVLMCYDGYDWCDNLITTVSGIFGIMIVLFPCACTVAGDETPIASAISLTVGGYPCDTIYVLINFNASSCLFVNFSIYILLFTIIILAHNFTFVKHLFKKNIKSA